ncbi:haloacid dehalogenase, type II [Rickenella mellea]|uniref:Haloacid dehalogenase, type II n=1 Tax=Rickenella mellea TaxID=50990 RepID=A0A4Y7Q5D7_9AGAM|nr:haloacid dehalogenase, type II [Rickenella mellea]
MSTILAFDIYGTLLDTSRMSEALIDHAGLDAPKATEISALWRRYQLEYTWRLNSMNLYEPFHQVTRKSFIHAASEHQLSTNEETITKLMNAYNNLHSFSDASPALRKLTKLDGVECVVFSNGTEHMVRSALTFGGIDSFPKAIYVADSVRKYKPAPEIYQGLLKSVGKEADPQHCWLVSGNPFDVVGACAQGLSTIWVDRAGKGWADRLGGSPTEVVSSLEDICELPELQM